MAHEVHYQPPMPIRQLLSFLFVLFSLHAHAANLSWKMVLQAAKDPKVHTVEQLLAKLPKDQLTKQIHIYHSLSLQGASFENPRVLVHNEDASFIMSFNGDPNQRNYGSIETVEFNQKTKGFEFRQLFFLAEGKSVLKKDEVLFADGRIEVSKTNPDTCKVCHGTDSLRPNWAKYFVWPGVYGGHDDNSLELLSDDEKLQMRRQLKLSKDSPSKESVGLKNFLKNWSRHPRYKQLPMPPMFSSYVSGKYKQEFGNAPFENTNTPFTDRLSDMNNQRIARLLANSSVARKDKYLVLGLSHCPLSEFDFKIPGSQQSIKKSEKYKEAYDDIYKMRFEHEYTVRSDLAWRMGYEDSEIDSQCEGCAKNLNREYAHAEAIGDGSYGSELEFLAAISATITDPRDITLLKSWSMNPIHPNFTFGSSVPENIKGDVSFYLRAELLDPQLDKDLLLIVGREESFKSVVGSGLTPYSQQFCQALYAKAGR